MSEQLFVNPNIQRNNGGFESFPAPYQPQAVPIVTSESSKPSAFDLPIEDATAIIDTDNLRREVGAMRAKAIEQEDRT